MRLRVLGCFSLALVAGLFALERATRYVFLNDAEIHRTAAGLEIETDGRDRPAGLPFQRQSATRLWENIPGYVVPDSNPPERMFNALGCRSPELEPAKTRPRVLCLGDSSTFGLSVSDTETYCAQLAPALLRHDGPSIEPMNCGVVGYSVLQGIEAFEELAPVLQPDVVVLAFGYNERWHHRTGDAAGLAARKGTPLGRQLRKSEAFLLFRHLLLSLRPAPEPVGRQAGPRVPVQLFEASLTRLCRRVEAVGAAPALLALVENPRTTQPIRQAIALLDAGKAAEAVEVLQPIIRSKLHRYPLVDELCARAVQALGKDHVPAEIAARAELSQNRGWGRAFTEDAYQAALDRVAVAVHAPLVRFPPADQAGFYHDEIHPNAAGHAWIADQLAQKLLEAGLLPRSGP